MDYVKREGHNVVSEDTYKLYAEALQKSQMDGPEYQHASISMEQLHQAMQNTLSATNFAHNLPIPLSPRQMSTLMLKTNNFNRNLHFNDVPAHLQRNPELELAQTLVNEGLTQNLVRNLHQDDLVRNIGNETDIQNLALTLNEQAEISRTLANEMGQHLTRNVNNLHLQQILERHETIVQNQNIAHVLLRNQDISQEVLDNSQRGPVVVQCVPDQIIDPNIGERLDPNIAQRIVDANIVQRLTNPIIVQRLTDANNVNRMSDSLHETEEPFHIKSEHDEDGFYYNTMNSRYVNNGELMVSESAAIHPSVHQENQVYQYTNHDQHISTPSLAPMDLYTRPQNYIQNYNENHIRENPQNLVIHRQYDNLSPYTQEASIPEPKKENQKNYIPETNENLKPAENKMSKQRTAESNKYYSDFYDNVNTEKSGHVNENKKDENVSVNIKGEYICYKCNDIFPTKRGLKQHTKTCMNNGHVNTEIQEKIGKYCCSQCPYRCQSPAILKIHERTHTGEKPFSCTFCDYKSGQKNNVAKHILVHMKEKPYRCQYCDYRCAQKNNLVVHERTHTGYKPFACSYCEYRTVQKPNLVKHMYLHTDQKPFSCDLCSYRCVQKTNLMKHKQRHVTEKDGESSNSKFENKPYKPRQKSVKCPYCQFKCVQKSSLDKHITFKHGDSSLIAEEYLTDNVNGEIVKGTEEVCEETIQNLSVKKMNELNVNSLDDLSDPLKVNAPGE